MSSPYMCHLETKAYNGLAKYYSISCILSLRINFTMSAQLRKSLGFDMPPWSCFWFYCTASLNGLMIKSFFLPLGTRQDMAVMGHITFLALLILGIDRMCGSNETLVFWFKELFYVT